MQIYKLTASQLANLLQIIGALIADYMQNPKKPMRPDLVPLTKTSLEWKDLPSLQKTIAICVRGGDKLQALFDLGIELKTALPVFRNNSEYSTPEITMLRAMRQYLATDSESALAYISRNASVLGKPQLAKIFAPAIPAVDNSALRNSVKSLVGRSGTHLTSDEARLLKETSPQEYEKYAALRKQHNLGFKALLTNYVRDQNKKMVDYVAAYQAMNDAGFTHSMVPGFKGMIDDQGRWYTKAGELIGGVPNLSTYSRVVMNPKTDPGASWEFKAIKPDGSYAYYYTAAFRRQQSDAKFENVAQLMKSIKGIRAKWMMHVKKFDIENKLDVCAVVLEVLFSNAARVGSQPGRGVGTLLVKNASQTQAGVNLAYIGKDSIPTKHIIKRSTSIEHAKLVDALLELMADKKPSEFLFTYEARGVRKRVPPSMVNQAFKHFGAPADVTVHKLRTCRGTSLFKILMDKDEERRPPTTEKDAIKRYRDMTEQVGKLLNHKRGVGSANEKVTGATAAISYIDSSLQLALFSRWGFRPPTALEKLLHKQEE